jgi:hypothetical protein
MMKKLLFGLFFFLLMLNVVGTRVQIVHGEPVIEYGLYRLTEPSYQFYAKIPKEQKMAMEAIRGPVPAGLVPTLGITNRLEVEPEKFEDLGVIFLYTKFDFGPAEEGTAGHFYDVMTYTRENKWYITTTFKTNMTGRVEWTFPLKFETELLGVWHINAQTKTAQPRTLFNASFTLGKYLANISVAPPLGSVEYTLVLDGAAIGEFQGSTSVGLGWLSEHKVSVIRPNTVEIDRGTRYVARQPDELAVSSEGTYRFLYQRQFYLGITSEFGNPIGEGWYDEATSATLSITSPVLLSNGTNAVFVGWSGDITSSNNSAKVVMNKPYNVVANWRMEAESQGRCIIATAAYGSEISPAVQALRNFRDRIVLSTFAGTQFMRAFNEWYYSFSPTVASHVTGSPTLQMLARLVIYPLIGILQLSTYTYSVFGFNSEIGITIAGVAASSMMGLVYGSPLMAALMICTKKRRWFAFHPRNLWPFVYAWIATIVLIGAAEVLLAPVLMTIATVACVLLALGLSATMPGLLVARKLR